MRYDVPTYLRVKSNIFSWVSSHGKTLLVQRVTFNWCEACIIPCQPAPPQAREGLQCYLYITEAATRNVRETGNQIIGKLLSMPYTRVQPKLDWRPYCINEPIKLNVNSWGHFLWPFNEDFCLPELMRLSTHDFQHPNTAKNCTGNAFFYSNTRAWITVVARSI